jgi:PAS domain S-box-containing protein
MALAVGTAKSRKALAGILRGELVPVSTGTRRALAVAIFAAALAARFALFPLETPFTFITFFPAVVLSSLLLGAGPGALTLVLCTAAAFYIFMPPFWAFKTTVSEIFAVSIFGGSGLIICFVAQQMHRRAHELRDSEKRFRHLFEDAPVGQLLVEPGSLRVLECNPAAADTLGYSREELCRLRIMDLDVGLGEEKLQAIQPRLLSGEKVQFESRVRRKDGQLRDLAVTVVAITAKGGNRFYATCIDTTEPKATEDSLRKALRESEDLYQNAPCGYHSLDGNGVIMRINDTELKLLGYSRDEVVGKMAFRDLLAPASLAQFDDGIPRFKEAGLANDLEFDFKRKDGALVPVLLSGTVVLDDHGNYVMSRSTVNDMTERKHAEDIQRRLSRSLRLLSESSMELVRADAELALLDAICRLIVQTGGYMMAWIGVPEQDAGRTVRPIARSGFENGYLESIQVSWDEGREIGRGPAGTAIRTGATQICQNSLDNSRMTPWRAAMIKRGYQSSIALPVIIQEKALGALTIYAAEADAFTDEEKALLEELVRNLAFGIQMLRTRAQHLDAEAQLQASQERLQMALSATNLGIFDFDIDVGRLECDARAREIWGVGATEQVSYAMFKAGVHPDDWPATKAAIDQAFHPAGTGAYNIQYRVLSRADGSERYVSASGRVIFKAGRAARSIGVVKDISVQKQMERAELDLRSELELISKQQVAAQTAAAIAHELNQPLVSISVYSGTALKMLARGNANAEKLRHALQGAVDQAQRAGRTLHELIAFLHKGEATLEPIDLNDLVQEANAISAESGTGKLRPVLELDPGLPPVLANRLQVQKVLLNLLLNSSEAMAECAAPTAAAAIKVKTAAVANMAQVTVQDSGPGLDAQKADRIFDPFFSTKPHGMGLGLAISRALIEAHGGQLWTDREGAPGATFHFTLPFAS